MTDVSWIAEGLRKSGKTKTALAKAIGVRNSAITEILKGDRRVQIDEAVKAARFLDVDLPIDTPRSMSVRLVGYVGAGAAMTRFADADDPGEEVDAPEGANEHTVAVQVRGESLGALFDRWLVFYDEVHNPPAPSMMGRLCVCGLADGRVLIKQIKRGQLKDHYSLYSNVEAPIYDVIVDWAAVVKQMTPR